MNSELLQILIMVLSSLFVVAGFSTAGYIMEKRVKKNMEKRGLE